jgi:ABC-type dipeptide/oligopeptide/nickel transport system permease component
MDKAINQKITYNNKQKNGHSYLINKTIIAQGDINCKCCNNIITLQKKMIVTSDWTITKVYNPIYSTLFKISFYTLVIMLFALFFSILGGLVAVASIHRRKMEEIEDF